MYTVLEIICVLTVFQAAAVLSVATTTSSSRAVTSILRYVLQEEIVKHFSWKGQRRWSEQKLSFSTTQFSKMLVGKYLKVIISKFINFQCQFYEKSVSFILLNSKSSQKKLESFTVNSAS